jgi:hypothetical protein
VVVERGDDRGEGLLVGRERERPLLGLPARRVGQLGQLLADALDQPGGEARPAGRVEQLVLDRRRARVEDEDGPAHEPRRVRMAWAWMAVIATVFTMSRTDAPRERSLTGLARPCRTGPIATAPAERWTAL